MNRVDHGLIVFVDNGKILLQHRGMNSFVMPNRWGFFGGKIEPGEKPDHTVIRETKEELGIDLKDFKLFGEYKYKTKKYDRYGVNYVFTAPFNDSKIDLQEGDGYGWFTLQGAMLLKMTSWDMKVIKDLVKIIKN